MSITRSFKKNILFPHVIPNCCRWLLGGSHYQKSVTHLNKVISISYDTNMESESFEPPQNLHGMKVLDKSAFNKSIVVMTLETELRNLTKLQRQLKKYLLRLPKIKNIQDTDQENIKKLLFNPNLVMKMSDFDDSTQKFLKDMNVNENGFSETTVNLSYDNWSQVLALRAVLPENEPPLTSFSIIGHIVHVNLKPHLLEYKNIIGQILLDKVPNCRTVVNKKSKIDNVYRNFEMELICGEPDFNVTVHSNGCVFQFDFSKVYWNSRLNTEHSRVIKTLKIKDVLFDVFCGVGPFSVPAAKKRCTVYANDLNPDSIKWLNQNVKLNKISPDYIQTFNKDASDFINNDVKHNMIKIWKDDIFAYKIVVVMNLPVLALDFLKCFKGLFKSEINNLDVECVKKFLPTVHCYFFESTIDNENINNLKKIICEKTDLDLNNTEHSIHQVRNVASTMLMHKLTVVLPWDYLFHDQSKDIKNSESSESNEPKAKRLCKGD